jgi:hypothetical protein
MKKLEKWKMSLPVMNYDLISIIKPTVYTYKFYFSLHILAVGRHLDRATSVFEI